MLSRSCSFWRETVLLWGLYQQACCQVAVNVCVRRSCCEDCSSKHVVKSLLTAEAERTAVLLIAAKPYTLCIC